MKGKKMTYSLQSLFGVSGRSMAIVGGSSGIGLEIACALADCGAKVAVIGRTREKVEKAGETLRLRAQDSLALQADVANEEQMSRAFAAVAEQFGTIDGLVNSAGINNIGPLAKQPLAAFRQVIDVNLIGMVIACRQAAPYMLKNGYGNVVNISSLSSFQGKSYYTAYSASKAAVDGFTRALAVEWIKSGVNVNSVAPGIAITDINRADIEANPDGLARRLVAIPRGKVGETSLLVAPVIHLLSPGSAHIVGQTICVDGGQSTGDPFVMSRAHAGE